MKVIVEGDKSASMVSITKEKANPDKVGLFPSNHHSSKAPSSIVNFVFHAKEDVAFVFS